jgi:hypothetical protein
MQTLQFYDLDICTVGRYIEEYIPTDGLLLRMQEIRNTTVICPFEFSLFPNFVTDAFIHYAIVCSNKGLVTEFNSFGDECRRFMMKLISRATVTSEKPRILTITNQK